MVNGKFGYKMWASLFTLLISALLIFSGVSVAAEPKPIRIGHLGEWTGPAGRTCGPPGDALIAYFHEYVNKEKGGIPYLDPKTGRVLGKVKVEVLYADCRYELPLFKNAYRKFVDKGVVACHSTSSPALEGLKKDFKRDKIPCFQTSTNTVAHWPPEWIFGLRPSFADDVGTYVNWILKSWNKKRAPRIALMFYDGPFGRAILWGGPEYAESKGVKVVAEEPVPPTPIDMTSQLLRIKQAKADFIIGNVLGSQAAVILKDMKRLGINIPFGTCTDTDAAELVDLAGEAAEGAYFLFGAYTLWDETRPAIKWVNEHYRKYMKGKAGYHVEKRPYPDGVWYVGWEVGVVMEECIRLALEKVPPSKLTGKSLWEHGIFRMKKFDINGLYPKKAGITYYKGVDHRGGHYMVLHRVKNLKDSMVTGWMKAPTILPPWMKKK
ncbi:MAG: ABC transporter substrate-binding protein [Deltaproteobacteria bacterium]|nr:ABC transporter substrate-binding protein [Deltaproteobacteria bacterium]